jgi:hypothetical protein
MDGDVLHGRILNSILRYRDPYEESFCKSSIYLMLYVKMSYKILKIR